MDYISFCSLSIDWPTLPSDDIRDRIVDTIDESSAFGDEDVVDEVSLEDIQTTDTGIEVIFKSLGGDCSEAWKWFNMVLADQDSEIGVILRETTMYGEERNLSCAVFKKFEKAAGQSSLTERTLEDGEELYQFLTDLEEIEQFFDLDEQMSMVVGISGLGEETEKIFQYDRPEDELTEDGLGDKRNSHPIVARLFLEHRKSHPRKHEDDEDDD